MKQLILGILFVLTTISSIGQTNRILEREVPRAGEFIDNSQILNETTSILDEGFESQNMSFQGSWPFSNPQNIISDDTGDIVFIASGAGVMIMDISNSSNPQMISDVRARGIIDHLYYDDTTQQLYITAYFSGFEIWDLSNITTPERVSREPVTGLPRGGIYAQDNYVYIITVTDGILVYDITDPADPVYISTTSIPGDTAWNLFAEDNFLYVRTYLPDAIRLFDISTPTSPVLRGSYTAGSPYSIFVKDGLGYIADSNQGLVIIDVSDPDNFSFVGNLPIAGSPHDVVVVSDYAYVTNWTNNAEGGLYAIDVSDPSNPIQTDYNDADSKEVTGGNDKVTVVGTGYAVFDVTDSGVLNISSEELLPGWLIDVAIKDDYAFTGSNGFRVFDVTDKSNPEQVAFLDINANTVDISGDILAYIPESMGSGNSLNIIDISDPENPNEMGNYNNMLLTQDAIIQGDFVYVGGWWDGFTIIDISDPTNPSFAAKAHNWTEGAIPGEEWCFVSDLDVQGDYVYLIDYKPFSDDDTKGLYIFDITDPQNPEFVSRYVQQSQYSWRIKVQGNYAYLGDGYGGIEVVDISDPQAPVTVAYQELLSDALYNLDVSTLGYVYAAGYIYGGVQAIDIADPENPELTGYYYPTSVFALNVTADESDIYVSEGIAGFQIYSHDELLSSGLDFNQILTDIIIYPNPSNGIINLNVEDAFEVVVFDQAGRVITNVQIETDNTTLDLSSQPNGIYFLKFKMESRVQLKKVIISK